MDATNTTNTTNTTDTRGQTTRLIITGAVAGMIAGAVMAMYAMIASATILHQGFFTPLYGIASPIIGPKAMMTSMQKGLYFSFGPALLGLVIHMMWSAGYGVIFGLIVRGLRLGGGEAIAAGLIYGLLVMFFMSLVVLPIVGVGKMPGTIGWPSFTVEHLLFGLTLGLWPLRRPHDFPVPQSLLASRQR
jgi:hypothetical protein